VNSERWQQIKQVFHDVSERELAQRSAFLAKACGDDVDLRAKVEKLVPEQ
jgi:hypothetical protein